jgi:fumarylacetoacetase
LSSANLRDLYWSFAQMVTHHTSNGCNLAVGDLIASGTVSGSEGGTQGSLLELTSRGAVPVQLPNGEVRGFLEDGDEIILSGFCERDGLPRISLGECRGTIAPALV